MDIKSKSKYLFIIWVLLLAFGLSGLFSLLTNGSRYMQGNYFESDEYNSQMNQFIAMLNMYELYKMPKEEMKKQITVSDEEIEEHRMRYGNLGDQISNIGMQYEDQIQAAIDSGNKAAENVLTKERDGKIADITENFNSDEYVRSKIVKEKEKKVDEFFRDLEEYSREFNYLGQAYKYYLKDNSTGEVITNLSLSKNEESASDFLNKKDMYYVLDYAGLEKSYMFTGYNENFLPYNEVVEGILENQKDRDMTGKIGLSRHASEKHSAIMNYKDYQKGQKLFIGYLLASIAALIASSFLAKRKPATVFSSFEQLKPIYRRIPLDIRAVLLLVTGLFLLLFMTLVSEQFVYYHSNILASLLEMIISLVAAAALLAFGLIQLEFLSDYRKDWPRLKEELNDSLLVKSYHALRDAFIFKSIGFQLIILLGIVFMLGMLFVAALVEQGTLVVVLMAFTVAALPILIFLMRKAGYLNKIIKNTEELVKGNLAADIPVKGKSVFARHAENVNALRNTVKVSHKEQAKSERLKTELITNVSHDLRTPLTSIITYTELLKTPDLAPEDRDSYIEILDRKSKRLKVLIDDLFEATKMASGNIELNKEKVDLNQLLHQALAEHNEALNQSSLQLRVSQPEHPVYAFVDGQKLWRVFDNLIGNILKYALENTRIYISVKEDHNQAVLTFKNITKYELGDDLEELFERFKRGDQSRHTEGSGLGLAIAKSIIDLHDGTLDIEVDGDLFKVTVILGKLN
ncbi:sensor histidine kinase [Mesobacillus jeotgali]|uniref:sensor histidine kinase n=1 Tax=Mesobacillus jeotgali TaxID=129985 RepID=UPI0009A73545|nr:HAMP domain-containing sensor histidine kinase [Mesobacillus jeotgali]